MTDDTARLAQYIDVWRDACAAFVDLCRSLDEDDAHRPTDLAGWDVHACVAHTAHLDVWMHEQDIRRALDRPGGYDAPAAQHTIDRLAAALPMVLGKRVAPPDGTSLRVDLPELERTWSLAVRGSRAAFIDEPVTPAAAVELTAEDFVVLAGGRRPAERTTPRIEGDRALATRFLEAMAVTP